MHRFLVVIERAAGNYPAYSPDLPGCVATGATREEAERNMHEAVAMHVAGLIEENGLAVSERREVDEPAIDVLDLCAVLVDLVHDGLNALALPIVASSEYTAQQACQHLLNSPDGLGRLNDTAREHR